MFITRATRHDFSDIEEMLQANEWDVPDFKQGTTFFARDGGVVGCIRLIEVATNEVIVDDVVVDEARRGDGIGAQLIQTAMNSRGGKLYVCCHDEHIGFYENFGFKAVATDDLPEPVAGYFDATGDLHPEEGHVHHFMRAR